MLRNYEADIVSAYRFDRTGEGPRRVVYSYVYNQMVRGFGLRLRDMNFAFKLCRRPVLDHVELDSEGSFIDVELLDPRAAARLPDRAVRRRLLPAHPGRVDAVVPGRDPHDAEGDERAARRADAHRRSTTGRAPTP